MVSSWHAGNVMGWSQSPGCVLVQRRTNDHAGSDLSAQRGNRHSVCVCGWGGGGGWSQNNQPSFVLQNRELCFGMIHSCRRCCHCSETILVCVCVCVCVCARLCVYARLSAITIEKQTRKAVIISVFVDICPVLLGYHHVTGFSNSFLYWFPGTGCFQWLSKGGSTQPPSAYVCLSPI